MVWWIVLIGAAWGLLPASRWTRAAWTALGAVRGLRRVDRTCHHLVAELGKQSAGPLARRVLSRRAPARHLDPSGSRAGREAHDPRGRGRRGGGRLPGPRLAAAPRSVPGRVSDRIVPSRRRGTARLAAELLECARGADGARPAAASRDRHLGSNPAGSGRGGSGDPDRDAVWLPDLLSWGRGVGRRRAARIPSPQPGAGRKGRHGGGDGCRRRRPDLGRRPSCGDRAGAHEPRRAPPGRHVAGCRSPRVCRRGAGPDRRRARRSSWNAAAVAHAHARPRLGDLDRRASLSVLWWRSSPEPRRESIMPGGTSSSQGHQRSTRTRLRASGARAGTGATTIGRSRSTRLAGTSSAGPALARSSCCGIRALRTSAPSRTPTRCMSRRSRKPASSGWLCSGRSSCWCSGPPSG